MVAGRPLSFRPGTRVEQSATNFLLLTEMVERISGMSYHDFVTKRQIDFLGLRRTGFAEDLDGFPHEDVGRTDNVHQLFKADRLYIDPTEPPPATTAKAPPSAVRISPRCGAFRHLGLRAGHLLLGHRPRGLRFDPQAGEPGAGLRPWKLPDGREVPAVAGWQFYKHRGLMDIKGSAPGFSSFLSRFTHSEELVCVTLMANREGVDFTNLGRRIAGAFGDLLSTNYDDNKLFLLEGQLPAADTVSRLEEALREKGVPLFAKYDHAQNAREAGLELRPTTVLVFGSPSVGTALMQADQSVSLELPLRISVWEDEAGSTWLAFPRLGRLTAEYGLQAHPAVPRMEALMEELVRGAGNVYGARPF
ncbi:MAG: DUF302 domain-containing protein [Anaerotruncus massiliensis (ex Togo et al. 2019)]